jgi:hypothetical protein
MQLCELTGKIVFLSASAAYRSLRAAAHVRHKFKPRGSAYRCRHCNHWHTTASEGRRR